MTLPQGTLVERYRVNGLIGSGAMGEVYLAVDDGLGRWVAVKILLETHRENPELRARFVREARAVARISHPNVVQVFATGEYQGRPYFAMEYLQGKDLGSLVRAQGPFDSYHSAGLILDAARGLQAAAQAGLIHRDVKPSNLVRLDSGPVKVTDFGLAKPLLRSEDPGLTALGVVVGTPDYIAPEQARGDDIDARVDVYALGCTLFYVLAGRPPFRKGNDDDDKYMKVVARHLRDPAPDARKLAVAVDDELANLSLSMMAKIPGERPSYDDLIATLESVRARLHRARPRTSRMPSVAERAASAAEHPPAGAERVDDSPTASGPKAISSRAARWLIPVTVVSAGILATGVGLTLLAQPAATLPALDAGLAVATPRPDAAPLHREDAGPPRPPAGMLAVVPGDGKPGFFVDRVPVSNRAYAEVVRGHRYPAADADRPIVGVAWKDAKAYATAKGKRLLRVDEWDPALATLGFVPAGMEIWEWVDDGQTAGDRPARRVNDGVGKRHPGGDRATTFRLAEDAAR